MRARPIVAAAALTLAGTVLAGASPSSAADHDTTTVANHLVGPLSVAQAPDGTRYWADTFAGNLYKQTPAGVVSVIYKDKKRAPEGVSADGGVLRFTTGGGRNKRGKVWTLDAAGNPVEVANIAKFEKAENPDGDITYGFYNTSKSCLDKVPPMVGSPYRGTEESHPYATAYYKGVTYVADAGANAVFAVSALGVVRTVAVVKPVKITITAAGAEANGLPACTVGRKFKVESVPTDIEVGAGGTALYVTSLPGGPEDPSLGANGRLLSIDPVSGHGETIANGLLSPTGVAVAGNGDIYVAQLFSGVISKMAAGGSTMRSYAKVALPAAIEATPTGLLATINAVPGRKPKGKVVTLPY